MTTYRPEPAGLDKLSITAKTLVTAAAGDHVLIADLSDSSNLKKVTVQTIVNLASGGGGIPTAITVANEDTDTSCFVLFATSATGDIEPKTNAGITLNSATNALTATTFVGSLTGNASGSSATLTTARTINGVSFNGSANITVTAAGSTLSDTVPVAKGGTGVATIGTAGQILQVNAVATAMEFITSTGGGNAQTSNPLSQFASTTSLQLLGVISDETGTGSLVFANSPTIFGGTQISVTIQTPTFSSASIVGLTGTKAQLDTVVSDGNILYVGDTIPVATGVSGLGTGVATALAINVGSAGAVVTTSSTDTLTNKTLTSPTMTAPVLGVAAATTVNKVSITAPETGSTLTIVDGATLTASATASVSGTNTGDNATNSQYSGLVSNENHTGDATGATALTLATVNSNVGSFGSTTQASVITVNAKGLVTAASNSTVTPAVGSITGLGTGVATALGLAITAAASTVLDDTTVSAMVDTLGGASATGAGGIVRGTSPTIATPVINGLPTGTGVATANTALTLVARDASGNFTAGTITAALTGTASGNMPLAGGTFTSGVKHTLGTYTPTGTTQTIDLNAGNITKLSLASASGNVTLTLTVPTSGTMQGTILALNGSTARNLIIAASDSSTIKFLCTKIDTSTDTASTRRAYTWMWDGTNLNVLQSEMSTT